MAAPPQGFPSPMSPTQLEAIRGSDEPGLYQTLKTIVDKFNSFLNWQGQESQLGNPPTGPRSVTASQLGGTIQILWGSDLSDSPIAAYVLYRVSAGTRSAPTTPTVDTAHIIGVMPAQQNQCLIGTSVSVGSYGWIDRNIPISALDPANPTRFTYWVASVDNQARVSIPIQASNSPIEAIPNGPGDQQGGDPTKTQTLNKLANAQLGLASGTLGSAALPFFKVDVTGASNAAPIQITHTAAHGYSTNDTVWIGIAQGNTAANGYWVITKVDNFNYTLNGSTGNGVYINGSAAVIAVASGATKQLAPPIDPNGVYSWSPWGLDVSHAAGSSFADDGTQFTQEIICSTTMSQVIMNKKFRPGMHFVVSFFAKISSAAASGNITVVFNDGFSSKSLVVSFSTLTSTYQRFTWNLAASTTQAYNTAINASLTWINNLVAGGTLKITRPMVNVGDTASGWTPTLDIADAPNYAVASTDFTTPTWSRTTQDQVYRDSSVVYA
jgi:hypothetical protein